ncbi:MAG: fimbria major subunit, partial [Muribaculaceae bacterium]|nr:fimbria major subunit [Muribaculaceae bacterium]
MKKIYKYLFSILIGGALLSCADDNIVNDTPQWQEGDTPYYIKLKLRSHSDSFTRADNVPGSGGNPDATDEEDEEYKIGEKGNFAIFFDGEGKYISWSDLYSVNPTNTTPGMDATYTCRFYGFTDREPKKVLVVVNASEKIYKQVTTFPGWTLDEVYKHIWEECGKLHIEEESGKTIYRHEDDPYNELGFRFEEDEKGNFEKVENGVSKRYKRYFTMTNTTYVKNNEIHCAEDLVEVTTDPEDLDELNPTIVYLERMVSKFSLDLGIPNSSYQPTISHPLDVCVYHDEDGGKFTYYEAPWALDILGWGLNGLETKTYLFKNLPDVDGNWITHPGWNSVADRRSFWTLDPHYSDARVYPWQFDEAKDIYDADNENYYDPFLSYDNQDRRNDFVLTYYPLTHFAEYVDSDGKLKTGYTFKTQTFYTPENAFEPGMQVDHTRGTRAYELAGTHIIVAARLRIKDPIKGTGIEPFEGNIYRNRVGVTYIDEVSMFEDFMNAMNYKFESQKYIYYKYYPWNEEERKKDSSIKNGQTLRAESKGAYALYYLDPDGKYYEMTSSKLRELDKNEKYQLYREADALDADGKVIPWIMYNNDTGFKPQRLFMLYKDSESNYPPGKAQESYDPTQGEILDPSKFKNYSCEEVKTDKYGNIETDNDGNPETETITVDFNTYLEKRRVLIEYLEPTDNDKYGIWAQIPSGTKDDNDIQSIFYEISGPVDCYNHGLMYYAIPIYAQEANGTPALGTSSLPYPNSPAGFEDLSLKYYYGVIRNNWYNFTLHSIGDLGYPVENPNKPIVPNYNDKKD